MQCLLYADHAVVGITRGRALGHLFGLNNLREYQESTKKRRVMYLQKEQTNGVKKYKVILSSAHDLIKSFFSHNPIQ